MKWRRRRTGFANLQHGSFFHPASRICITGFVMLALGFRPWMNNSTMNGDTSRSVDCFVLCDFPLSFAVVQGHRKEVSVSALLIGRVAAFAAVVKDAERRRVFPLSHFPRQERVPGFGITDECRVFPAIAFFPIHQFFFALSVAQGAEKFSRGALRGAVAQRIQLNRVRNAGEWVTAFGPSRTGGWLLSHIKYPKNPISMSTAPPTAMPI